MQIIAIKVNAVGIKHLSAFHIIAPSTISFPTVDIIVATVNKNVAIEKNNSGSFRMSFYNHFLYLAMS